MLFSQQQSEVFTHFFPPISSSSSSEIEQQKAFQNFQKALLPLLNEKWREHREEVVLTIRSFKDRVKPDIYRECVKSVKRYINSRDFAVSGRYEVKKSWWFSGIQYYGETAAFHELNELMDKLRAEVTEPKTSCSKTSWSKSFWSMGSYVANLFSSVISFAAENPGKAVCSVLVLETAVVAALSVTRTPYHSFDPEHPSHFDASSDELSTVSSATHLSVTGTRSSSQHIVLSDSPFRTESKSELVSASAPNRITCTNSLVLGFMSSLLTQNPLFLGASTLFCLQSAYGQSVNGQVPNKLINVGDPFSLKINMTELFGESVTDITVQQVNDNQLPDWLTAGPMVIGSLATNDARKIIVKDNLAYVADRSAGLKLVDISNPMQPILKGSLETLAANGVAVNGNLAYIADILEGLKIIDVSNVTNPQLKGMLGPYKALEIYVEGKFAYIADAQAGLKIANISDVTHPILKGTFPTSSAVGITVIGNLVYIADWIDGLTIVNASNPSQPVLIGNKPQSSAYEVVVRNKSAFLACGWDGLQIMDVSNSFSISNKGSFMTSNAEGIVINNNLAFVADGGGGLKIIDISNETHPVLKGSVATSNAHGVDVDDKFIYVADGTEGIKILDLTSFWEIHGVPVTSQQKYDLWISGKNSLLQKLTKSFSISTDYFPIAVSTVGSQSIMSGESVTFLIKADSLFQDKDVGENLSLKLQQKNMTSSLPAFIQFQAKPFIQANLAMEQAWDVAVQGSFAYVAIQAAGLKIVDISNPVQPFVRATLGAFSAYALAFHENFIYLVVPEQT